MKTIKLISILIVASLLFMACEDWLDVKPKTQVESSELFKTEAGYKDALWGIYTQMTEPPMYGLHMTVTLDAMAKIYTRIGRSSLLSYFSSYNYKSIEAQPVVDAVWQSTYSTIANLNNLIANIQSADKEMFTKDNYNVIYGEALGLRAFLHFDLLRLFAPSYADDPDAAAIPYVVSFNSHITETSTVSEVIELVLKDLNAAAALLKEADPIATKRKVTIIDDYGYLLDRQWRFNYYAVVATMARVYLYKNDKTNAALKAREVIDDSGCKWTSVDYIAVDETERDRTFTSEQVFALKVEEMETNIEMVLSIDPQWVTNNSISVSVDAAYEIYPYPTDWRGWDNLYFWSRDIGVEAYSIYRIPTKLWQYNDMPVENERLMPLIRLPEMKLILAECNPTGEGAKIINDIREHRGITEVFPADATEGEVMAEIRDEYQREFYCEGILWYYYKRRNSPTIPYYNVWGDWRSQSMNREKYVWPMPEEEREFGNRNSKTKE